MGTTWNNPDSLDKQASEITRPKLPIDPKRIALHAVVSKLPALVCTFVIANSQVRAR